MNKFSTPRNAIIMLANYAPFPPGRHIVLRKVQSRMLLWCKSGAGNIHVNGSYKRFLPGEFVFLPWNHVISYTADSKNPFYLAGIHIIPDFPKGMPVNYQVFHHPQPKNNDYLCRKDVYLPVFEDIYEGDFNTVPELEHLAEYIVLWFQSSRRNEQTARRLAVLLLEELMNCREESSSGYKTPVELKKILDYIRNNLNKKIEIRDLSRISTCSPSTLSRQFRRHLKTTPVEWIINQKMRKTAELLTSTSLRISEVGENIGIEDPYYFSKLFKKTYGITASEYRKKNAIIK